MTIASVIPNGHRTIMASRREPKRSRDPFPTPPWATRALLMRVFPHLDIDPYRLGHVWEPACGEGHMAEVLKEYAADVWATDKYRYGYGLPLDFLRNKIVPADSVNIDFIITNPPFGEKTELFVTRALQLARVGVAMFVRLQWLETVGRYERVYSKHPPTLIAFFSERVNICKGRWDPDGSTATAYIWLVWVHGKRPRAPFWIPPGCRQQLTRPDDRERFTAHPVKAVVSRSARGGAGSRVISPKTNGA